MSDPIRMSGMVSGLDTESIIGAMMTTYQSKIDNQNKKLTKLTWQQEAYQAIAKKMTDFQSKYFDILNKNTYLMSSNTFNKFGAKISSASGTSTSGLKVTTTAASKAATHKFTVLQTAKASTVKGGEITPQNFKLDLDKALQSVGGTDVDNGDGTFTRVYNMSMDVKVGGVTKTVSFSGQGVVDADGNIDMDAVKQNALDNLNTQLQAGFGYTGNHISSENASAIEGVVDAENGHEWFLQAELNAEGGIEFIVGGNATVSVTENKGNFGLSAAAASQTVSMGSVVTGNNAVSIDIGGVSKSVSFEGVSSTYYDSRKEEGNEAILEEYNKLKEAAYRKENNLAADAEIDAEKLEKYSYTSAQAAKDKNSAALTEALNNAYADEGITFALDGSKLTAKNGDEAVEFTMHAIEGGTLGLTKGNSTNKITSKTTLADMGLETDADGNYTMRINDVEISVGADSTIDSLVKAVNSSDAGVKMSYSALTNSFSLEAKELGGAGDIRIEGSELTTALGITDASGAYDFELGQNAAIELDGEIVYLNENSYNLDGTTFEFTDEIAVGETFTIGIEQSYDDVKDTIKSFVEDYNKLIDEVYDYIGKAPATDSKGDKYDPLTDEEKEAMSEDEIEKWESMAKQGILYNDRTVSGIMSQMRTALYNTVTLDDGSKIGLFSLGIKTSNDYAEHGKLEIDEEQLDKMLSTNLDAVTELFTNSENGLMKQLDGILDGAVKATGSKESRGSLVRKAGLENSSTILDSTIFKEMENLRDRILSLQDKYDAREDYWWGVFTNLESMMSDLNNQSSYIGSYFGGFGG